MEVQDALTEARRRIDEISANWQAHHDVKAVTRALDDLSPRLTAHGSLAGLVDGAARLIEHGEPVEHRLDKLSDHLHGYVIGWFDAAAKWGR